MCGRRSSTVTRRPRSAAQRSATVSPKNPAPTTSRSESTPSVPLGIRLLPKRRAADRPPTASVRPHPPARNGRGQPASRPQPVLARRGGEHRADDPQAKSRPEIRRVGDAASSQALVPPATRWSAGSGRTAPAPHVRRTPDQREQPVALVVEVEEVRAAVRWSPHAGAPPARPAQRGSASRPAAAARTCRDPRSTGRTRPGSRRPRAARRSAAARRRRRSRTRRGRRLRTCGGRRAGVDIDAVPVPVERRAEVVDHRGSVGKHHQRGPGGRLVVAVGRREQPLQPVRVGHRVVVQQRAEPGGDQRQRGRDAAREAGVHRQPDDPVVGPDTGPRARRRCRRWTRCRSSAAGAARSARAGPQGTAAGRRRGGSRPRR